ncbi:MAG TPA: NUDIX hydrolase [Tepidisphaeraceae bacterium]|jgi:ADP-ribose pyrophosphatase
MSTILDNIRCLTPDLKWLKVWSVDWRRGERRGNWTFVSRKKEPMVVTGKIAPDAVVVVATRVAADGGHESLVVTKEYRCPLGGYYYGFPAGLVDEGETPAQAAARELKEETGLEGVEITKISPPVFSSAGLTDESAVLVYMTVAGEASNAGQDESEDIETLFLSGDQLLDLYRMRGAYADARISVKMWPVLDAWLERHGYMGRN